VSEGGDSIHIGRVLGDWLLESGLLNRAAGGELERAWCESAGAALAAETRVLGLRREQLWVEVISAPLRAELEGFLKPELLERLRERYTRRHISDIRFVVSGSPG